MKRGRKNSWSFKQIFLLILLVAFTLFNVYYIFFSLDSVFTGKATFSTGLVALSVQGPPEVYIYEPVNTTYNFSVGEALNLNLSVGANTEMTSWWYDLYDVRHNAWITNVAFSPNVTFPPDSSFNVFRWQNQLFVHGLSVANSEAVSNVSFFVYVPNSPPVLFNISSQIFVCEASSLAQDFFALDVDEDDLTSGIFPGPPFFVPSPGVRQNLTRIDFQLFSGILSKSAAGGLNGRYRDYSELVSVGDGQYSDSASPTITVIEINNPPVIEDVSVQTLIWNRGDNSTFIKQVASSDFETSQGYGGLNFSRTIWNSSNHIVNLFNINSTGFINFTATNLTVPGPYTVQVCVDDTGLLNPYPPIGLYCGQTGNSITSCDNFSITITNENRAPTITNYTPQNLSFNAGGYDFIEFNISKYDPDGTIPDAYWHVDGVLYEKDEGGIFDVFNITFGCGISGLHKVLVNISDGLLNDSLNWTVDVGLVPCPSGDSPSGGGGGGGGGAICIPKWGCDTWSLCQNAQSSLNVGLLSGEDYRDIQDSCENQSFEGEFCGFQLRSCSDLNKCFLSSGKPGEIESCKYTENPSCSDGIKNCHSEGCEFLIDCGGPCNACPTCSDNIRNQGEEGEDCGGPCPWKCVPEVPLLKRSMTLYIFLIISLILIIIIIIRLIRVLRYKKGIAQETRRNV